MRFPLKLALPVVSSTVCALLMAWDIHNQRIIMAVGMGWDTGAPLWPYQTPDTILHALNLPAFLVSLVSTNHFEVGTTGPLHSSAFFSAILVQWWLIGWQLDKDPKSRETSKARVWAAALCVLATGLVFAGLDGLWETFRWWWTYSRELWSSTDLILLRNIAPAIWCFVLSFAALSTARRRIGLQKSGAV